MKIQSKVVRGFNHVKRNIRWSNGDDIASRNRPWELYSCDIDMESNYEKA